MEFPCLGEPLLDEYLRFVAARCRPNTLLAQSFNLKVFFTVIGKPPLDVGTSDLLRFIEELRFPRQPNVVRLIDGESGLAASTVKRRLATISGLFDYLTARGEVTRNPVPRGLSPTLSITDHRKALDWRTPAEAMAELLASPTQVRVASTG